MPNTETIGIVSKPGSGQAGPLVRSLVDWLQRHGYEVRLDEQSAEYAGSGPGLARDRVPDGCRLVIVLGGDGTLLSAARAIGGREIPLLAVNLGGLGFLTAVTVEELIPELERSLQGENSISTRHMLQCELWRNGARIAEHTALNDVVITKSGVARMIDLTVHVDDHFMCWYKADGLIVSTPTGSTAYSLSAGGPIIYPTVATICITPICPHMLTNRPVLVPDESVIQVSNRSDSTSILTIDGQVGEPLESSDTIICKRSSKSLKLIRPPRMLYFDVLREKLSWGER